MTQEQLIHAITHIKENCHSGLEFLEEAESAEDIKNGMENVLNSILSFCNGIKSND